MEKTLNIKKENALVLGVTGGIASGKTTVANLFFEMGAPIIDFDLLARTVVEPEEPAFKDIVDYFGEDILQKGGEIDRKRLSTLVFVDPEKRKKLEAFTHPRIVAVYLERVDRIAKQGARVIIQAVIPLLYEVSLQHLVHKVLVVYIPREKQLERLIGRDGLSQDQAAKILAAQLPIEEKAKKADFVIDNSGHLDETKRQVEKLWPVLKKIQKE